LFNREANRGIYYNSNHDLYVATILLSHSQFQLQLSNQDASSSALIFNFPTLPIVVTSVDIERDSKLKMQSSRRSCWPVRFIQILEGLLQKRFFSGKDELLLGA
ncbi:hypothetical protein LINPERHAP1_LOCUS14651, partial [Linum perenne]